MLARVLSGSRYLNLFHVYLLCICGALVFSLVSSASKSTLFILMLLAMVLAGLLRLISSRQALTRTSANDMLLWGAPPVLSGGLAMMTGTYDWGLLPFMIIYLMQAFILGTAGGISPQVWERWVSTGMLSLLLAVPLGFAAIAATGSFSPFTIFNQDDGSLSKNVFAGMLFVFMIFNCFILKAQGQRSTWTMTILMFLCLLTGSRGMLLGALYFIGAYVLRKHSKLLLAPVFVAALITAMSTIEWDPNSDNRLIRLANTVSQMASGNIYDDGNNDLLRLAILYSALAAWQESPVFGLGPGHDKLGVSNNLEGVYFASDRITSKIGSKFWGTHNFYMKILVEYGFLSTMILLYFYRVARRLRNIDPILFHGFIAILLFSATNNLPTGLVFFSMIFLFQAVSLIPAGAGPRPGTTPARQLAPAGLRAGGVMPVAGPVGRQGRGPGWAPAGHRP